MERGAQHALKRCSDIRLNGWRSSRPCGGKAESRVGGGAMQQNEATLAAASNVQRPTHVTRCEMISLSTGDDLRVSVRRPGGARRGGEGREGWGRVKRGVGGGGGGGGRGGGAEKSDHPQIKLII